MWLSNTSHPLVLGMVISEWLSSLDTAQWRHLNNFERSTINNDWSGVNFFPWVDIWFIRSPLFFNLSLRPHTHRWRIGLTLFVLNACFRNNLLLFPNNLSILEVDLNVVDSDIFQIGFQEICRNVESENSTDYKEDLLLHMVTGNIINYKRIISLKYYL